MGLSTVGDDDEILLPSAAAAALSIDCGFPSNRSAMGLLDKLWDDVVAGPQPDQGLSRLRGNPKLHRQEEAMDEEQLRIAERRRSSEFLRRQHEARSVSQSIPILKKPPRLRVDALDMELLDSSAPSTPGASSTPNSSFAASPLSNFDRERVNRKAASVPCSPALGSQDGPGREIGQTSIFHSGRFRMTRKPVPENIDKQTSDYSAVYDCRSCFKRHGVQIDTSKLGGFGHRDFSFPL